MFFGATTFAAAPFAGVGIVNITVQPTGNQINLATGTVSVISWIPIDPNATGIWIPIDPDNP